MATATALEKARKALANARTLDEMLLAEQKLVLLEARK